MHESRQHSYSYSVWWVPINHVAKLLFYVSRIHIFLPQTFCRLRFCEKLTLPNRFYKQQYWIFPITNATCWVHWACVCWNQFTVWNKSCRNVKSNWYDNCNSVSMSTVHFVTGREKNNCRKRILIYPYYWYSLRHILISVLPSIRNNIIAFFGRDQDEMRTEWASRTRIYALVRPKNMKDLKSRKWNMWHRIKNSKNCVRGNYYE